MAILVKIISQYDPKGSRKAESAFDSLTRSAKTMGLAVGAAAAAVGKGLYEAVQAAAEDQKSFEQLAQSMRNVTKASDALIQSTDKQLGKMSMAAGIADDKLRPAFSNLLRATGSVTLSQKGLTAAMDLSVATGKDLDAVSLAVGKALNGQTTALFKMLPGLRGVVDEGSSAEEVLAAINSQVGGAAQANTKTFAGSLERLKVIFGEMVETVGAAFLPILTQVADFLNTKLSAAFTYLSETVGPALENGLGKIAAVFEEQVLPVLRDYVIPTFLYLADIYYTKILPAVGLIAQILIEKLGAAFTMIREKIEENAVSFGKLRDFMDKAVTFVTRYLIPTYGKALGVALDLAIGYVGFLIDAFVKVGEVVGPIMAGIVKAVGGMIRGLVGGLNAAVDAVNAFIGLYNRLPGFLKPWGDVGLLPNIELPSFDLTNYKPGGFGYFGENRGDMGAVSPGGLNLGGATSPGGSPGGRSGGTRGGGLDLSGQAAPSMGQTSGFNPNWDLSSIPIAELPFDPLASVGGSAAIIVNINGGLATSADIGRVVVDSIKQYTNISGPADIAVA
jgi:hypothetical protein